MPLSYDGSDENGLHGGLSTGRGTAPPPHWPTLGWSWWPPRPTLHWNVTAEANCWQKQETHKGVEPIV